MFQNFQRKVLRTAADYLDQFSAFIRRLNGEWVAALASYAKPAGRFVVQHWRAGVLIALIEFPNGITDVGLNHLLQTEFGSGTQVTTWSIGIVDNSGFTAFAAADTASSHTGWNEFTNYSQSTRVTWGAGTASARAITNASPATFDITGGGTLKGIFVTTLSTKSGTTGTLWSTAAFASTVTVVNGDQLKVTYTVSG